MLYSVRQYCKHVLVLFGLFVAAATVHPLVHTHAPGHAGCSHTAAHEHQHDRNSEHSSQDGQHRSDELPCDLHEAMATLAPYTPVVMLSIPLVFVGQARVTSLPATTRGAWGTFGGRGPPASIS